MVNSGKRKGVFCLLLLPLLLILGVPGGALASRGYIGYKSGSSLLKFTFLYPGGWEVIESEGKHDRYNQVQVLGPESRKSGYRSAFVITVSPVKRKGGEYSSLEEKVADYKEKRGLFKNFKLLSEKEITLAGMRGKEITASFRLFLPVFELSPAREIKVRSRRVFLRGRSYFYELGYETEESTFPRYSKAFDKLLKSFALKKEALLRPAKGMNKEGQRNPDGAGAAYLFSPEGRKAYSPPPKANRSHPAKGMNPEDQAASGKEASSSGQKVADTEKQAVEKQEKKGIKTLVKLNFKRADISEVIHYLSRMSGLAIALDERALKGLKNSRVSLYTPAGLPLTDALDLILKVKGLDYVVNENYIWIARKEQLEKPVTKAYQLKYGIRDVGPVELAALEKKEK